MRLFFLFLAATSAAYSLSLEEAESLALSNNPQVRAAEELVERAKFGRKVAITQWLPQLSLISQAFKTEKPIAQLALNKPSAFLTQVSLTQALFSSDLYRETKISSLIVSQFEKLLEAAKNDVLYQTRALFYLVALDHKKLATAKEHIELLSKLAERMEGLHQIGEATSYNVNQARVAMVNVTDTYYEIKKRLKSHQDELAQIMGYDPVDSPFVFDQTQIEVMDIPELAGKIEATKQLFQEETILQNAFILHESEIMKKIFSHQELIRWTEIANNSRPDILLSQTHVSIADEGVKKELGHYLPTLSFLGNYGGGSTPYFYQPSTQFNNQSMQWAVGLSFNWLIFDSTGRENRVRRAKAGASSVKFDAKKTLQAAHTDVRTQIYTMEKALAKYLTASANLKLAEETLQQALSQLEIGFTTMYDYLISVDGLIRAKTALDEGRYELLVSHYSLLHSCGIKKTDENL